MPALSVDSAPILPLQSTAPLRLKVAPVLPDRHVFQRWLRWKTLFSNGPRTRRYEIRNPAVVFINTRLTGYNKFMIVLTGIDWI